MWPCNIVSEYISPSPFYFAYAGNSVFSVTHWATYLVSFVYLKRADVNFLLLARGAICNISEPCTENARQRSIVWTQLHSLMNSGRKSLHDIILLATTTRTAEVQAAPITRTQKYTLVLRIKLVEWPKQNCVQKLTN